MPAYGRGGAGNIEAAAAQTSGLQRQSPLYSLRPLQAQAANHSDVSICNQNHGGEVVPDIDPVDPPAGLPEYKHTGRGGAGNWIEPRAMAKSGTYTSTGDKVARDSTESQSRASGMYQYRGRGGAGNFEGGATEHGEKRMSVEMILSERAREDVELELPRPEQAHLGGRERIGNVHAEELGFVGDGALDPRVEAEMLRYA